MSIALLRGKGEIVKYLMDYLMEHKDRQSEIVGRLDDENLCTYMMGTICTYKEAYDFLESDLFVKNEFFLCSTGDMTPVMNSAYFGRPHLAHFIAKLAEKDGYKDGVYKMVL